MEEAENRVDFGRGALPIGRGEREEGERVNAEAGRGCNDASRGIGAGTVPGGARQPARGGPAAVTVGDDSDVEAWG